MSAPPSVAQPFPELILSDAITSLHAALTTSFAHRGHAAKRSPRIRAAQGSDVEGGRMPQQTSQSLCVP